MERALDDPGPIGVHRVLEGPANPLSDQILPVPDEVATEFQDEVDVPAALRRLSGEGDDACPSLHGV